MDSIVFATSNPNKIREVQPLLDGKIKIIGLKEIGCHEDIPETQDTIEGNAIQKAAYVYENYGHDCFAEDTGLQIEALNGEPGVYSARYAGPQRDPEANMNLALQKLGQRTDRSAQFKTVVALIVDGKVQTFEGVIKGQIGFEKKGEGGFGYDPLFTPEGYEQTFAQMPDSEKNKISHRAVAIKKLIDFLRTS